MSTDEPKKDSQSFADVILCYLEALGVEYIFGVPGGAIEPLYNSLAKTGRKGGIKAIVARHECGAAFMADGYARETGKLGVVCSTTGPGATNLITGVASAHSDRVPMLVITAQTPLPKFGRKSLQDSSCAAIDVVSMFRHCTSFNTLVSHPQQVENKLISALMTALRTPKGTAHISIPSDILRAEVFQPRDIKANRLQQDLSLSDQDSLEQMLIEIHNSKRIALFLGDGCRGAGNQIQEIAEKLNAPFVTGPMGKRWIDETHPMYRGVYGFAGHESAKATIHNTDLDLVIAIGAQLGELGTSGWLESPLLSEKLIHVDSTPEHFTRSPMARLHVCGKIPEIAQRVIQSLNKAEHWAHHREKNIHFMSPATNINNSPTSLLEPEKCFANSVPLKPQKLFYQLAKMLPQETRVHVDAGNAWSWATHYYQRKDSKGLYRIAMGFGSMGWAISSAIGARFAKDSGPTLCITGDGSYLMSAQEITVAAQHNLPVVILVLNDAALGMVKHGQKLGNAEPIGYELNHVSYADLAESMGIRGITVKTPGELADIDWSGLFKADGPTLIDAIIDPDEIPPMGERVKGLAQASATPGG
ncbi:putative acetolactate synthase large subunit [Catenovulum agarivorans DS-2]|uniref:Putative acetolactate synthase large subunit n=1 Tax=Catenovulum agarivorans DS-2 TaxID=1328313 RepID=W7QTK5_9ALTE|nr:thiamine pyrophosphate-binding protein [Catenovulum agarivorans]EWH11183.1 putative acetolactate synthase large subunit [Catenovulum agarivorans DS-2]